MNSAITIVLPALGGGGVERLFVHLANDWAEHGFQVSILLMEKRGEFLNLVSQDVKILELNVKRYRDVLKPLVGYLKRSSSDVVITAMWPLNSIVAISWFLSGRRSKLFLSEHENLTESYINQGKENEFIFKKIIKYTYSISTGVVAVSNGVKQDLINIGELQKNTIKVIYNPAATGVDMCQEGANNKYWRNKFEYHILSVGRLAFQKDHETLIKAFSFSLEYIDAELVIVGQGELKKDLLDLIRELNLGDRVRLVGFQINPSCWYKFSDLFVLSSRWEGFGNVIVEALEYGVPVLSTDCPSGPSEILENGRYGSLVPIGDTASISKEIIRLVSMKHDKKRLIERANEFSVKKISLEYLNYIFQ
ncbi:glycosyltransferase [bacterium]|nr:glycosyltransferase [bacterium]